MTGHSKWVNIQHRKKLQFARRGKIFTRLIKEINIASHLAGDDAEENSRLRFAIEKAQGVNMPSETIQQAIASADLEGHLYKDLTYEGFFMGEIAILIHCVTDNIEKTDAAISRIFKKFNISSASAGSVSHMFSELGELCFAPGAYVSAIENVAIDSDAEDVVKQDDGTIEVLTTTNNYTKVLNAMKAAGLNPDYAEITMHASIEIEINKQQGIELLKFISALEDFEDTQNVCHNADIPTQAYE